MPVKRASLPSDAASLLLRVPLLKTGESSFRAGRGGFGGRRTGFHSPWHVSCRTDCRPGREGRANRTEG